MALHLPSTEGLPSVGARTLRQAAWRRGVRSEDSIGECEEEPSKLTDGLRRQLILLREGRGPAAERRDKVEHC